MKASILLLEAAVNDIYKASLDSMPFIQLIHEGSIIKRYSQGNEVIGSCYALLGKGALNFTVNSKHSPT